MRLTATHFKKVLLAIATIAANKLWQLWQFVGLLLFEAPSCLLCQVELGTSAGRHRKQNDREREDDGREGDLREGDGREGGRREGDLREGGGREGDGHSASAYQSLDLLALRARVISLRSFARARLCLECMAFFCDLTEVKTTLIGDDDSAAMTCFSSGFYNGPLQEAVYQIKYLKRPELAQVLAFTMLPPTVALLQTFDALKQGELSINKGAIIVPVPLHKDKLKERGFNQAEELAISVGKLLDWKIDSRSLKRIRATRPQFGLSRGQRRRNLSGAFEASKSLAGKRVILVDDVLTSGATLYECAQAVATAGGIVLGGITLARAKWQRKGQLEESTVVPAISLVL